MTDLRDHAPDGHGRPDQPGHTAEGADSAADAVVDRAVARVLDRRATVPLPEDFARHVAAVAAATDRERRQARRSARVAWIGLAVVALLLLLAAPALAPAAAVVYAPLARILAPIVADPLVGLVLVAIPVLWALGQPART